MTEQTNTEQTETTTVEIGFDALTEDGTHELVLRLTFPKDKGMIAASALATQMSTVIGPSLVEALHKAEDASLHALFVQMGIDPKDPGKALGGEL